MANLIEQAKLKADELLREAYASAAAKGILPEGAELKGTPDHPVIIKKGEKKGEKRKLASCFRCI